MTGTGGKGTVTHSCPGLRDNVLSRLERHALVHMREALRSAGLPEDDLRDDVLAFRLDDASGVVGWAALETCGDEALLRSVVVVPERRGTGGGSDLVSQVIASASEIGVQRLWLLTETAAPFFERLGFQIVNRAAAPDSIQATSEFRGCCPGSAICLVLALPPT